MSASKGRVTQKYLTICEIIHKLPNVPVCTYIETLKDLVVGELPLPPVYLSMDKNGQYEIVGWNSENIIYSLAVLVNCWVELPELYRKINKTQILCVIIEPNGHQEDLVDLYSKINGESNV